ncbi:hypothetical protein [Aurantimonas sp. 22II-16-19i]|uniref:hypothetical protein n=1 Tax=Aurantimonas sp. 22II-16-19i TaxID=1317114 RepID=UPI0009F7FDA7|nr:hypothetical protein [Aurantimonas sp. 22II-16-19i]ORE97765.1 hypothetical protein ATO4_07495 [Aurantimonas sp. 22II-16-19i]
MNADLGSEFIRRKHRESGAVYGFIISIFAIGPIYDKTNGFLAFLAFLILAPLISWIGMQIGEQRGRDEVARIKAEQSLKGE